MNLFQDFIEAHFRGVEARFPKVECTESEPSEVTDSQVNAQDSLFGVLSDKQEKQLRSWE